jgi:hypothetical protein
MLPSAFLNAIKEMLLTMGAALRPEINTTEIKRNTPIMKYVPLYHSLKLCIFI